MAAAQRHVALVAADLDLRALALDFSGMYFSKEDLEHIKMHGGRVWVEDRLDGLPGARFVIELMATELVD